MQLQKKMLLKGRCGWLRASEDLIKNISDAGLEAVLQAEASKIKNLKMDIVTVAL